MDFLCANFNIRRKDSSTTTSILYQNQPMEVDTENVYRISGAKNENCYTKSLPLSPKVNQKKAEEDERARRVKIRRSPYAGRAKMSRYSILAPLNRKKRGDDLLTISVRKQRNIFNQDIDNHLYELSLINNIIKRLEIEEDDHEPNNNREVLNKSSIVKQV